MIKTTLLLNLATGMLLVALSYVVTFGTDSSLKTTRGWDNVTGLGTPNRKAFADFFNPAH